MIAWLDSLLDSPLDTPEFPRCFGLVFMCVFPMIVRILTPSYRVICFSAGIPTHMPIAERWYPFPYPLDIFSRTCSHFVGARFLAFFLGSNKSEFPYFVLCLLYTVWCEYLGTYHSCSLVLFCLIPKACWLEAIRTWSFFFVWSYIYKTAWLNANGPEKRPPNNLTMNCIATWRHHSQQYSVKSN